MTHLYINKAENIFYCSNFTWEDFQVLLGAHKEITLNLLVLKEKNNPWSYGSIVDRLNNRFDKPFDKIQLFSTWESVNQIVNQLINSTNFYVYEYDLNIAPKTTINTVTQSEIIIKTNSTKSVKDEILNIFQNNTELIDLINLAHTNIDRIIHVNDRKRIISYSPNITNIEDYLYSR